MYILIYNFYNFTVPSPEVAIWSSLIFCGELYPSNGDQPVTGSGCNRQPTDLLLFDGSSF